jgi:hypothetical protein
MLWSTCWPLWLKIEVLSRAEFATLPVEHQEVVYRHMDGFRHLLGDAPWSETAYTNFKLQFKGYVAAQYFGDLLPREGEKSVTHTWYRKQKTQEEDGVYRWREIEQCQQLALSQ